MDELVGSTVLFTGPAKEAVKHFSKNINVSALLSLAGIGPEKTMVTIVCDPDCKTNTHEITVKGAFGEFTSTARNLPSPENPGTSYLASLSAICAVRELTDNIRIG
ncbi:aspartate dehydrogenase domain-containing protein [Candidatus Altiarchaeota archaeon]